jgi:hypothetical protein
MRSISTSIGKSMGERKWVGYRRSSSGPSDSYPFSKSTSKSVYTARSHHRPTMYKAIGFPRSPNLLPLLVVWNRMTFLRIPRIPSVPDPIPFFLQFPFPFFFNLVLNLVIISPVCHAFFCIVQLMKYSPVPTQLCFFLQMIANIRAFRTNMPLPGTRRAFQSFDPCPMI